MEGVQANGGYFSAKISPSRSPTHPNSPSKQDVSFMRSKIKDRMENSDRIADILQKNLQCQSNQRGNIIFNSLTGKRRMKSRHAGSKTPVADPRVYSLIGKLHHKNRLPFKVNEST